jgi:Ca-activated chloride channel family protein
VPIHKLFRLVPLLFLGFGLAACNSQPASRDHADTAPAPPPAKRLQKAPAEPAPESKLEREASAGLPASKPALSARQSRSLGFSDSIRAPSAPTNRDRFAPIKDNGVKSVAETPVSTFSIDVDSGSYAVVRRWLNEGRLPPSDAVRVEELVNYFDYAYPPAPAEGRPFSITTEVSRTPWNRNSHLVQIGIKGRKIANGERPPANLVFLIDVSGSMNSPDKLPLLKSAFRLLAAQLDGRDRVSMVVYAGASGLVLEPTPGSEKGKIMAALERLSAGGSTHGSAGIELAYATAEQARIPGGINRVILATDGDFNVGTVNHAQLIDLIEQKRARDISLTTLGFGHGNYNDHLMEQLADKGNGNYAYIDTANEARKVLVEELSATLQTIAKDVKIQIEWNPAVVSEYRLIGYENRVLAREDFNNDKVDAGDIGAGHTVTALYEITLAGQPRHVAPLRYGRRSRSDGPDTAGEVAFVKLRYKEPDGDRSQLISQPIRTAAIVDDIEKSSDNLRFSAAVAGFGQLLRGGRYTGSFGYGDVAELARGARGDDAFGYRGEFLRLVSLAGTLDNRN